MFNPFKKEKEADFGIYEYEFLARIFGVDEAKKHLLNVVPPAGVTPEQVLSDSSALEMMTGSKGWGIFEKAVWFELLTALRLNLAAKTLEEREAKRNQILALLGVLHLPYKMRFAADNIRKMKELEKSVRETQV